MQAGCRETQSGGLKWCVCLTRKGPTHSTRPLSFELPGIQFAQWGDAFWSDPPCFQCFDCPHHVPSVDSCFSSIDYRIQRRKKTLAYAQALQDWVEKAYATPSSRSMAKCVAEMQEMMHGLVDFTLKDLQVLPALDLALRSKLRAMPKAALESAPQPKKKDQSPMCQRAEKLKAARTASTSEVLPHPPHQKHRVWSHPCGLRSSQKFPSCHPWLGWLVKGLSCWSSCMKCDWSPPLMSITASLWGSQTWLLRPWGCSQKALPINFQGLPWQSCFQTINSRVCLTWSAHSLTRTCS